MPGFATTNSSTKRSRKDDGTKTNGFAVGSGSATPVGKNKSANPQVKSTSPLAAALAVVKIGMQSLPKVSHPFLETEITKVLRSGAQYRQEFDKYTETKSTSNYVASSARKLNIELQASTKDIQESQAFTTLRDSLTAKMEAVRIELTRDYIIPASKFTLDAKEKKFHTLICNFVHTLAKMYIAQYKIEGYDETSAILDILVYRCDEFLAPFKMTLVGFLTTYKELFNLATMPDPSIALPENEHGTILRRAIDKVNNITTSNTTATTNTTTTTTTTTLVARAPRNEFEAIEQSLLQESDDLDDIQQNADELMEEDDESIPFGDTQSVGGRIHIMKLIHNTIVEVLIRPIIAYGDQMSTNEESKRIKEVLTSKQLDSTSARISLVLGNEPPVPKPVLKGLVKEISDTGYKSLQRRIQSIEDVQASATSKKVAGGGTKKKKGTSIAAESKAPKKKVSFKKLTSPKFTDKSVDGRTVEDPPARSNATAASKRGLKGNKQQETSKGKKQKSRRNSRN